MLNLTCKNCQETKPTTSFYIAPRNTTGYRSICADCYKHLYPSKYEKKPPEYFEQKRQMRLQEMEQTRIRLKAERNALAELTRPLREAVAKEKKKKQHKEYVKRKRAEPYGRRVEKINERCAGLGKLSSGIIKKLLITQECKCVYCGIDISKERHVDHIVPIALGGKNTDDNVQLTCPKCNIDKSNTHPLAYKHGLTSLPSWLDPLK